MVTLWMQKMVHVFEIGLFSSYLTYDCLSLGVKAGVETLELKHGLVRCLILNNRYNWILSLSDFPYHGRVDGGLIVEVLHERFSTV